VAARAIQTQNDSSGSLEASPASLRHTAVNESVHPVDCTCDIIACCVPTDIVVCGRFYLDSLLDKDFFLI